MRGIFFIAGVVLGFNLIAVGVVMSSLRESRHHHHEQQRQPPPPVSAARMEDLAHVIVPLSALRELPGVLALLASLRGTPTVVVADSRTVPDWVLAVVDALGGRASRAPSPAAEALRARTHNVLVLSPSVLVQDRLVTSALMLEALPAGTAMVQGRAGCQLPGVADGNITLVGSLGRADVAPSAPVSPKLLPEAAYVHDCKCGRMLDRLPLVWGLPVAPADVPACASRQHRLWLRHYRSACDALRVGEAESGLWAKVSALGLCQGSPSKLDASLNWHMV